MPSATDSITAEEEVMSVRTFPSLSGQELAALRREAGLTQTQLARAAGIGRHAASYWETKPSVDPRGWAPKRMFEVLGIKVVPHSRTITPAQARARHGVLLAAAPEVTEVSPRRTTQMPARRRPRQPPRRIPCGAKTRKGEPCRMRSEPGRRRCRLHGGMSTGPKTPEGRARIAEAQRRRWAERREAERP